MKEILISVKTDEGEPKKMFVLPRTVATLAYILENSDLASDISLSDSTKKELMDLKKAFHEAWFESSLD